MQIIKVINNNVISSEDDKGKEIIVMGKGIGFGKKAGEEIDETKSILPSGRKYQPVHAGGKGHAV